MNAPGRLAGRGGGRALDRVKLADALAARTASPPRWCLTVLPGAACCASTWPARCLAGGELVWRQPCRPAPAPVDAGAASTSLMGTWPGARRCSMPATSRRWDYEREPGAARERPVFRRPARAWQDVPGWGRLLPGSSPAAASLTTSAALALGQERREGVVLAGVPQVGEASPPKPKPGAAGRLHCSSPRTTTCRGRPGSASAAGLDEAKEKPTRRPSAIPGKLHGGRRALSPSRPGHGRGLPGRRPQAIGARAAAGGRSRRGHAGRRGKLASPTVPRSLGRRARPPTWWRGKPGEPFAKDAKAKLVFVDGFASEPGGQAPRRPGGEGRPRAGEEVAR